MYEGNLLVIHPTLYFLKSGLKMDLFCINMLTNVNIYVFCRYLFAYNRCKYILALSNIDNTYNPKATPMNPINLFYAKILQYFTFAGIKAINVHAQASFIFAATLYFYFLEVVQLFTGEASLFIQLMILAIGPMMHVISYFYFNNVTMENKLAEITKNESAHTSTLSSLLTIVLVLPMIIFFTITVLKV